MPAEWVILDNADRELHRSPAELLSRATTLGWRANLLHLLIIETLGQWQFEAAQHLDWLRTLRRLALDGRVCVVLTDDDPRWQPEPTRRWMEELAAHDVWYAGCRAPVRPIDLAGCRQWYRAQSGHRDLLEVLSRTLGEPAHGRLQNITEAAATRGAWSVLSGDPASPLASVPEPGERIGDRVLQHLVCPVGDPPLSCVVCAAPNSTGRCLPLRHPDEALHLEARWRRLAALPDPDLPRLLRAAGKELVVVAERRHLRTRRAAELYSQLSGLGWKELPPIHLPRMVAGRDDCWAIDLTRGAAEVRHPIPLDQVSTFLLNAAGLGHSRRLPSSPALLLRSSR